MHKSDQGKLQLNRAQLFNPEHFGPSIVGGSLAQHYKKMSTTEFLFRKLFAIVPTLELSDPS